MERLTSSADELRKHLQPRDGIARAVPVGEEDPLGFAGGSRGVDEAGDLIGLRTDRFDRLRPARRLEGLHAPAALPLDQDQMLQGGDLPREILHLLQNFRLGDEKHLDGAVGHDILPDPGEFGFVHGDEAASQAVGCIGGDGPLGAVVRDDPHGVSPIDPEPREPGPQIVHPPADLPVGRPFVGPSGGFCPEQGPIRIPRHAVFQEFHQIVRLFFLFHDCSFFIPPLRGVFVPPITRLVSVQRGESVCSVLAWFAISRSLNHQYRFSPFIKGSIWSR